MTLQSKFFKSILFLGDIFVICLALFLTLFLRGRDALDQFNGFLYNFLVLFVLWIFLFFILSLYDLNFFRKKIDFFINLIIFSISVFFIGVTYFYFRPVFSITPKTILLLNIFVFDVLFLFWRHIFNLFLETKRVKEKVIIIGFYKRLSEILPQIKRIYNIEAIFCPAYIKEQNKCLFVSPEVNIVFEISDLKKIVAEKRVTSVIFSLDFHSNKDLVKEIFNDLSLTLNYVRIDDLYESMTKKVSLDNLDEVWFLEKISRPENVLSTSIKRIFDIFFSVIGLIMFFVLCPVIALLIKIETGGPVFYKKERVGFNGKVFTFYKFGTMTGNDKKENDKNLWRMKDKNQITKVGKILRGTHLDELPQAWNILKGEMSFVGPRPEWVEIARVFEKEIPFYKQRYLVKPGLFGWAQINFPASTSVNEAKEKFEYDLFYIKNRSIVLDLEIILKSYKLFAW